MTFFEEICRNLGLMFHNIKHPESPAGVGVQAGQRQPVSHIVEEQRISPTMTLRRTTIEEVEISHAPIIASEPASK